MSSFDIDVLIVGADCASSLPHFLEKARLLSWSRGEIHLYYLDLGSSDDSVEVARQIEGVKVIDNPTPSSPPGLAYNLAWRKGGSPYVQFLTTSCLLDEGWLESGMGLMGRDVGAVAGLLQPLHPEGSIFNWIRAMEWRHKRPTSEIGRTFLIRRELLEEIDGFDEQISYGLMRDISEKIDATSWRRLQAGELMATCDLGCSKLIDWIHDGIEDGEGRASLRYREGWPALYSAPDMQEIVVRGGVPHLLVLLFLLGWIFGSFWWSLVILPAALLLLWPRIFRLEQIGEEWDLSPVDAAAYGWHISLEVIPQFWGWFRFLLYKLFPR